MPTRYGAATQTFSRTVDGRGLLTSETDLNGHTTTYTYDSLGRVQSIVRPVDSVNNWHDIVFIWSENSTKQSIRTTKFCTLNTTKTDCNSAGAVFSKVETFDNLLRLLQVESKDIAAQVSRFQNFAYNVYGQPTFTSYAGVSAGQMTGVRQTYDALQRPHITTYDGGGTETVTYLSGNKRKVNNTNSKDTTTTYQSFGIPEYVQQTVIDSPQSVVTTFDVDVLGVVNSVTQSGLNKARTGTLSQTEHYLYNGHKQLCMVKRKDVGHTAYHRNALNEIQWLEQGVADSSICPQSNDANKISYSYDNLGDLHQTDYPDTTPDVTYTLDNQGNLTNQTAGTTVQTYTYNSLHTVSSESFNINGKVLDVAYGFDNQGYVSGTTYPNGSVVEFAPNAFGQPSKATRAGQNYVTGATYYPNGILDSFTFGNNITHKTTLNNRQLPDNFTDRSASVTAMNLGYSYDHQLNIKSITDGVNTAYSLSDLSYDGLDRLTSTTGGSAIGNSSLSYDGLGNITRYSSKGRDLDYNYDTTLNRLTTVVDSVGGKNYNFANGYDGRGNVTSNGIRSFSFNRANQLTHSGGNRYVYDGFNRRVKTVDSKGTSYSFYNQSGQLLYREVNGDGVNYIYLGKKLIAKDGVMPTNNNSRQHYRPFGETIETPKDDIGYAGHKYDSELGLSYMQQRYFDPVIGRFMSNDPVGFTSENPVMSFNRYIYVNNNPYKYKDSDGEFLIQAISGLVGGYTAAVAYKKANPNASKADIAIAGAAGAVVGAVTGSGVTALIGRVVSTASRALGSTVQAANATGVAASSGIVASAIAGATSGGVSNAATQVMTGDSLIPNSKDVVESTINGAVSGAIGGLPVAAAPAKAKDLATLVGAMASGSATIAQTIEDK